MDGFDTRGKLESVSVPTLSIHGLSDIMVEPKLGDYISDRIPGCRVLRIPDAGHIIKPALYQKEFLEHVASHDVQRASLQAGRRRSNPAFGKYSVCASVGQSNTNKR